MVKTIEIGIDIIRLGNYCHLNSPIPNRSIYDNEFVQQKLFTNADVTVSLKSTNTDLYSMYNCRQNLLFDLMD